VVILEAENGAGIVEEDVGIEDVVLHLDELQLR
jgi:hypothetical protein